MSNNPILDELYAIREKLQADAGDDLHRIVTEARQRALASGRVLIEQIQQVPPRVIPAPAPGQSPQDQSASPAER